jgi:hypothetical protein
MRRHLLIVCVSALVVFFSAGVARAAMTFTDPTLVNLLERRLLNGSYGLTVTQTSGTASGATIFRPHVGWYVNPWTTVSGSKVDLVARYTFASPVDLGRVMVQWRAADHSPGSYTIRDQTGDIVTGATPANFGNPTYFTVPAGRPPSTYIEFVNVPGTSGYLDVPRFGAYLAPGSSLAIDSGNYNIFYEEREGVNMIRSGGSANWTDKLTTMAGAAASGSVTYQLSQNYSFLGAFITHLENTGSKTGARFEVSEDGINWLTAFGPATITGTTYVTFPNRIGGDWLRFSWTGGGGGGGNELVELQVFALPEPGSLALAGLAGAAVLLRRRRGG